jgi:hypothetical protein
VDQTTPLETITAALQARQDSGIDDSTEEDVTIQDVQRWADEPPRGAD